MSRQHIRNALQGARVTVYLTVVTGKGAKVEMTWSLVRGH